MTDKKINDLIEIPDVKTVIQLSDIKDPELKNFLTRSFLLTEEVREILISFFNNIFRKKGQGYFIKGNFGSGKSHLLGVLSLLLTHREAWDPILDQLEDDSKLKKLSDKIINEKFMVLNISLVEHSNREYLEDIVISEITKIFEKELNSDELTFAGEDQFIKRTADIIKEEYPERLQSFLRENNLKEKELFTSRNLFLLERLIKRLNLPYRFNFNRQDIFNKLADYINGSPHYGIVILIDELSEFLRSKPDGRRFNEDIRFLQFLGEFSEKVPCWVAATLQEEIEKTGETTPEAFNKIKDRYPVRFYLSGAHIKEIISNRLIKLKDNAEFAIKEVYDRYQRAFPGWSVTEREFISLYPVHPLTVKLLANLKPLFSQHRGIIDFIHYRLKGSESRQIEGMLNKKQGELLTPDYIFDHFTDRIREMMETSPYYEKVYRYYQQEIDSILNKEEVDVGLKIIKLLILFSISPLQKEYDVQSIAHMLLIEVTDLEAEINYEYIDDILKRLYKHGAYLVYQEEKEVRENKYYIDLDADINLIIKRKKEYIKSNLFSDDRRIFRRIAEEIFDQTLPLQKFLQNPKSKKTIYWQNTARKGFVYFIPFTEISIKNVREAATRVKQKEEDFIFFIGYAHRVEKQRQYLQEVLLPELSGEEKKSFIFWLPSKVKNKGFLKDVLSRLLLLDEYQDESDQTGREIKKQLKQKLDDELDKAAGIFRDAYYDGELVDGRQQEIYSLKQSSYLPFERLLQITVSELLGNRFPRHQSIAPYQQVLTDEQVNKLLEQFLLPGEINDLKKVEGRVMTVIDSYLKPMGLIKKHKNSIRVNVKAEKNPLIKKFFSLLQEEKTEIAGVYHNLRKGKYGLQHKQFKLLVFVLLYSGYLTAYSEKQKISLKHLNSRNFKRIKYLGYGEIIQEEFQKVLAGCALLPPRFKNQPFSLPLQQEIWDYLIEKKREMMPVLDRLEEYCRRLQRADNSYLPVQKMLNIIESVKELLSEIKVSYSSEEGLERFASEYRSLPHMDKKLDDLKLMRKFLEEKLAQFQQIKNYLTDSNLHIPSADKYSEIKENREKILSDLKNEAIVFNEEFYQDVKERFEEFREKYSKMYRREHKRQLASDRFVPYKKIKESKSYSILSYLSQLKTISVRDDLIKIDRMLSKVLRHKCERLSGIHLQQRPVCECGFQLGQDIDLTTTRKIKQNIEKGIKQYLNRLHEKENKKQIEEYLDKMEAVGEKRFARPLRDLLAISPDNKEIIERLEKIINRRVIKRLNQALASDISIVERDLDSLYDNLVGRSFSPAQLEKIFEQWLEGDSGISSKTYIKVCSQSAKEVKKESESVFEQKFEAYLNQYYPELLPVADKTGAEEMALFLALLIWEQTLGLKRGDILNIIEDFIAGRNNEFKKIINEESSYNSCKELARRIFIEGNDLSPIIRKRIDEYLKEDNLEQSLIAKINLSEAAEWLQIMQKEMISDRFIKYLLIKFISYLENNFEAVKISADTEKIIKKINKKIDDINGKIEEDSPNKEIWQVKRQVLDLAVKYFQLNFNLNMAENAESLDSAGDWKEFYRERISNLEYYISSIKNTAGKLNMDSEIPLSIKERKVQKIIIEYDKMFSGFYESSQFMVAERAGDEEGIYDLGNLINEKFKYMKRSMRAENGICLLMDGMRWDLWRLISHRIIEHLPLRRIKEGSLFALEPTNTERQLEVLRDSEFSGEIITADDVDPERYIDNNQGENCDIIKFSYIDDKVHSSREDYHSFIEEVIFQTENRLMSFLDKLPSGVIILLFADHGFCLNYNFNRVEKYESPRYLHGGKSMAEVIVPWSLLYKP
ncbi:MAG: DUF6079 family protein [Halanaerobiales bacterium]